jgi:hypothetical protein
MKNNYLLLIKCCSIALLTNGVICSFNSSEILGLTANAQTNPVAETPLTVAQSKPESSTLWSFGTLLLLPLHIIEACAITVLYFQLSKSKREQENNIKNFKGENKKLSEELKEMQKKFLESDTKLTKIEKSLISSGAAANVPKPSISIPVPESTPTPIFVAPVVTEFAKPPEVIKSDFQFLDSYNRNPDSFAQQYALTIVSEDATNINDQRSGNSTDIILSENSNGSYWLIKEDNITYLIPCPKVKIQEQNIHTVRGLFDCSTFNPNYNSFTVVQPAIVSVQFMADGLKWKVEKKGDLKFN